MIETVKNGCQKRISYFIAEHVQHGDFKTMNEWNFFFVEYGSNLARLYLKVGMGSKRDSSYSNVHISQRKKSLPQKKKIMEIRYFGKPATPNSLILYKRKGFPAIVSKVTRQN